MNVKTRRKLTIRRFAYYLLIAAIVVSCVTNGIFAKFTTEDDGGDGARVAKFGVVLSVAGDLFSTTYNKYDAVDGVETDASNMPAVYTEVTKYDGISVQARCKYVLADGTETDTAGTTTKLNNVIAPGTKNDDGLNISIQGTAETDLVIEYEITSSTIALKTKLYEYEEEPHTGYIDYKQKELKTSYSYCIMVQMKDNIIREDNFEEFKDTLYIADDTVDGTTTYTRVTGDFDNNTDYYQAKDVATFNDDYYIPITYDVFGYSSIAGEITVDEDFALEYGLGYHERNSDNNTSSMQRLNNYTIGQLITDSLNDTVNEEESVFPYKSTSSGKSDVIETGTDIDVDLNLIWEWPFVDLIGSKKFKEVNSCDTILGHLMAGNNVFKSVDNGATYIEAVEGEDYNLEIEFDINITINQVD